MAIKDQTWVRGRCHSGATDSECIVGRSAQVGRVRLSGVGHFFGARATNRLGNEATFGRFLGVAAPTTILKVIAEREIAQHVTRHIVERYSIIEARFAVSARQRG
jgi:hypothetical protein